MKRIKDLDNIPDWEILTKYLADECSEKENILVEEWIKADSRNEKEMIYLRKIWDTANIERKMVNSFSAWEKVDERIKDLPNPVKNIAVHRLLKSEKMIFYTKRVLAVAAVLVLLIGFHYFAMKYFISPNPVQKEITQKEPLLREIVTKKGEIATIKLADGTSIKMNSSSKFQYPVEFNGNARKVYLYGEAYFEVAYNPEVPFIVQTNNSEVKVLGTSFNVTAWQNERETDVVVGNGKVLVSSKKSGLTGSVTLTKGQRTSVLNDEVPSLPQYVNVIKYFAWMQEKMVFENTTFYEVCKQLERRFDFKFQVKDSTLLTRRLTGVVKNQSLDATLHSICMTMSIMYEKKGNFITFYDPKKK